MPKLIPVADTLSRPFWDAVHHDAWPIGAVRNRGPSTALPNRADIGHSIKQIASAYGEPATELLSSPTNQGDDYRQKRNRGWR
jgi:hypothetical protein